MTYDHLFIVTAFTNFYHDVRDLERKKELLQTVQSIRHKVPNVFILVNEGSNCQHTSSQELEADEVWYTNVVGWSKSHGDHWLWFSVFSSEWFNTFSREHNIQTVTKISGRYCLLPSFDWENEPLETHLACVLDDRACTVTYFFRFHHSYFPHVLQQCTKINEVVKHAHGDIEHLMYQYNVFTSKDSTTKPIGVGGMCAGDGKYHEK